MSTNGIPYKKVPNEESAQAPFLREEDSRDLLLQGKTESAGVAAHELTRPSSQARIRRGLDSILHFEYQTHQGHDGHVRCVDGSDDMGWILSGGKDCSARLWHYSEQDYQCYRLARVWKYDSTVQSVAFAGEEGPAVVVTKDGHLYVQGTSSAESCKVKQSDESMNDLRVKKEAYKDAGTWLLLSAGGKCAYLTETFPKFAAHPSVCEYECKQIKEFPHKEEVEVAMHVPGDINDGAAVVTLSGKNIWLMNLEGDVLQKLSLPEGNGGWESFHISDSLTGWLAGASESAVYMWPVANGKIIDPVNTFEPAHVAKYLFPEGLNDVMMHRDNDFFMVQRGDMSFELRYILPDDGQEHICSADPSIHDLKLIMPKHIDHTKAFVIKQTVKSHEMYLGHDDEIGPVALCGFQNGVVRCWDLEGDDRGEMTSEIRSMTMLEVLSPIMLRFVTFIQVTQYAFGPSTKFSKGLEKPAAISRKIAVLDVTIAIDIDPAKLFVPQIIVVFLVAASFLLIVFSSAPERLNNAVNSIMRSEMYAKEAKDRKEAKRRCMGCAHFCAGAVSFIQMGVSMFIILNSSVFVVPMSKKLAQLVDCEHPEDAPPYLSADPSMICWGSHHLLFVRILAILWPVYVLVLIPHVLVSGDSNYMKLAEVLQISKWATQARRKATVLYIGVLHPRPDSIVKTKLVEFFTKMALPVIVILTTHTPLLQTVGVAACGLLGALCSTMYPPLVQQSWNTMERNLQLFTFLSMSCGILSVILPGTNVADFSLIGALLFCVIIHSYQIRTAGKSKDEENQLTLSSEKSVLGP